MPKLDDCAYKIPDSSSVITLREIVKRYRQGEHSTTVLNNVSFNLYAGEACAILGTSGSGKSTLLNILGLLDLPDSGEYRFAGQDILTLTHDDLAGIRNRHIGFVFQGFNLLPRLSALDNVALALTYRKIARRQALEQAARMLQQVGLGERLQHKPCDLSGGQRQRVAIARALVGKPTLVLADEPTGNLDDKTAQDVMALLLSLNRLHRVTLVVVTHDSAIAAQMQRQIKVDNGRIIESVAACAK